MGIQNWDPTSPFVFINIYKHCSPLYPRATSNGGVTFPSYVSTISLNSTNGYPKTLSRTSSSNFVGALCDIGAGGNNVKNGTYSVFWSGHGKLGFDSVSATIQSYNSISNSAIIVLHIPPNRGLNVRIMQTNVTDPLHNIVIVPQQFAHNYSTQIFQPEFLQVLKPFNHIRFTGWQKISCNSNSKSWAIRTKSISQTQHGSDGVAIEHMVDLIRVTNISSVWFSFPIATPNYTVAMLSLLGNILPSAIDRNHALKVYIEIGASDICGDGDHHSDSIFLFDKAASIFAPFTNIKIINTASIANIAYVPYLVTWFGKALNRLQAIGVPGQFGRSVGVWDSYNSYGQWSIVFANYSVPQMHIEIRKSALMAEQMLNTMRNKFLSYLPSFEFVSHYSGAHFAANNYGYRSALYTVNNCVKQHTYPCSWANTHTYFRNRSEVNASYSMLVKNASLEQKLDDLLISVQHSGDPLKQIYLDFLRRWEAIGGGLLVSSLLVRPVCNTGGGCQMNDQMFDSPVFMKNVAVVSSYPKYQALVDYAAGIRSTLPYTSADIPILIHPKEYVCAQGCKWGTCFNDSCVCFAGYSGVNCSHLLPKPNRENDCNADIGVVPNGISDWSSEWSFVNLHLTGRAWISQDFIASAWALPTPQNISQAGYPRALLPAQKLGTMMMRDLRGHMRSGTFICLYDGDGILTFGMDIVAVVLGVGRIEVKVAPSTGLNNGVFLSIERTNPLDPIRNIRFIMPGFEETYRHFPFHPMFLDTMKIYKTIRFMGWQNTNGVTYGSWNDRTILEKNTRGFSGSVEVNGVSGGGNGVSIEYMILLANTLGANAWFNMPHLVTDEHVRNFALLVNQTLRPDVKIYIEYSNEVWGTLFNGGIYAQQQGLKMGISTNSVTARFCFYMLRSNQIFAIWKDVFGGSSRLEFVISSQAVNPDVTNQYMKCASVPMGQRLGTTLAIAPYFGSYNQYVDKNFNIFMNKTLPSQIKSLATQVAGHKRFASLNNLTLSAYESGEGMEGSGRDTDIAILAVRDYRMNQLYSSYYNMLRTNGMTAMMTFISTGLYSNKQTWGVLEATDQDPTTSPKYAGIVNYTQTHGTCSSSQFKAFAKSPFTCNLSCSFSGVCVGPDLCECFYGSSGKYCEVTSYTEHVDLCGYKCTFSQGVCAPSYISGKDRYWACQCAPNYYGHQCSLFDCTSHCNYNGKCLNPNICQCYPGYNGTACEVDCGCKGHGKCSTTPSVGPKCICDEGYTWSYAAESCVPSCRNNSNLILMAAVDSYSVACSGPDQPACQPKCQYGDCINMKCACWAGYTGSACDIATPAPNANSMVGTNMGGVNYYSSEWAFVDAMMGSSDWVSNYAADWLVQQAPWGQGPPITNLRPDGYPSALAPGQVLSKLLLRDVNLHTPSGRFVCFYDGDGEIEFSFNAKVATIGKGRIEFDFTPTSNPACVATFAVYCGDNGILLTIVATNPLNPIHNIRVIMPGFEATYATQPFHPLFLKTMSHYSAIRFMPWQNTNSDLTVEWSHRAAPGNATIGTAGVPLEYMIQLSNTLGADPWFCIPHRASNGYIANFTATVKKLLRPDLKVYIEYSNEVWNRLFPQGTYASQQGLALGLSTDSYIAEYRYYAQRSKEIFHMTSTLPIVRVISTQSVSSYVTNAILSWLNHTGGHADVLGVTGYFDCGGLGSPAKSSHTALMNISQVIAACIAAVPTDTAALLPAIAVAKKFNMSVQTYEAGISLVESAVIEWGNGPTAGLTALFINTNRDPGMLDVYAAYMAAYQKMGLFSTSRPFMSFVSTGQATQYGSWGVLEFTGQQIESSPKYMALRKYFFTPQPPLDGCIINVATPTTVVALNDFQFAGGTYVQSPRSGDVWVVGSGVSHIVRWFVSADKTILGLGDGYATVNLWKGAYCGAGGSLSSAVGGSIVQILSSSTSFLDGALTWTINSPSLTTFDGSQSFFIEVKSGSSSYFSDVFAVRAQALLAAVVSSYRCSPGNITAQTVIQSCSAYSGSEFSNPLSAFAGSAWTTTVNNAAAIAGVGFSSCLSEYPASWGMLLCTVDLSGCRNLRTVSGFKPITDCVARLPPFPAGDNGINEVLLRNVSFYHRWGTSALTQPQCAALNDATSFNGFVPSCLNAVNYPSYIPTSRPTVSSTTTFPTFAHSNQPSVNPTKRPTLTPTTNRPTLSPSVKPSSSPSTTPSKKSTFNPTLKPTISSSNAPSFRPANSPTVKPSSTSTTAPSNNPVFYPTIKPSGLPTNTPTKRPNSSPTVKPSSTSTTAPSNNPVFYPTIKPSGFPINTPSKRPTSIPTWNPTVTTKPSFSPTAKQTKAPTCSPTSKPTSILTNKPTANPTYSPTGKPSKDPTQKPTTNPSFPITYKPSISSPTRKPTNTPTSKPTKSKPSARPTSSPSLKPTPSTVNSASGVGKITPSSLPTVKAVQKKKPHR